MKVYDGRKATLLINGVPAKPMKEISVEWPTGRVIDRLRKMYPDLTWNYSLREHIWKNTEGWYVYKCASIIDAELGRYLVHYRRSDTDEKLSFLPQEEMWE